MSGDIGDRIELVCILEQRMKDLVEGNDVTLSEFLHYEGGISLDISEALVTGNPYDFSGDDVKRIANCLKLSEDLLICFLMPVSDEYAKHALGECIETRLNPRCPLCEEIIDWYEHPVLEDELFELAKLALEHVIVDEYDLPTHLGEPGGLLENIIDVGSQLDDQALKRVLAYAYQEFAGTTDGKASNIIASASRFRDEINIFSRQVFDRIASAGGELSINALQTMFELDDLSSLTRMVESSSRAARKLKKAGLDISDEPVRMTSTKQGASLTIDTTLLESWTALMAADQRQL